MATEKRLIDANDVYALFDANGFARLHVADIDTIPTVDASPVVRCKDCVHWYDKEETCLKIYSDGAVSPYAWQFRKPDDFCSYGERRSDERTIL